MCIREFMITKLLKYIVVICIYFMSTKLAYTSNSSGSLRIIDGDTIILNSKKNKNVKIKKWFVISLWINRN